VPDPTVQISGVVIATGVLAIAVAASVVLIMALGMIGAIVDHHLAGRATKEAMRLRAHIEALETTKRQLEETSEDLGRALAAADSANAAKSLFLAAMSHELRTPLNAVIGFSEMLRIEAFGPLGHERYRGYADDIHASGAHLLGLINDVLDISRIDSGNVELDETKFETLNLVDGVVRMMLPHAAKAQVRLDFRVAPGLPRLLADRRRLRQVLINLVANAIKFTPPGGQIVIVAEAEPGGGLRVLVKDTGIGIAAGDIPKAFERFRQVDASIARKYEGAGLGLPLARDLVELHGGSLALESTPGAGTTATILLPETRLARTYATAHAA
jgi:signal transduction histidine kinase